MAERPHFAWPFERDAVSGKVKVVEQDSLEHVDACCQVIVRCPTGWRLERPEFGWEFPEFRNAPVDPATLVTGIKQFEPRQTSVRALEFADAASDAVRHISVDVEVGSE